MGISPRGFRTDRCLADWARSPFVRAVEEAYAWLRSEGGGFSVAYPNPPALLLRAVLFYASEVGALEIREMESKYEDLANQGPDPG